MEFEANSKLRIGQKISERRILDSEMLQNYDWAQNQKMPIIWISGNIMIISNILFHFIRNISLKFFQIYRILHIQLTFQHIFLETSMFHLIAYYQFLSDVTAHISEFISIIPRNIFVAHESFHGKNCLKFSVQFQIFLQIFESWKCFRLIKKIRIYGFYSFPSSEKMEERLDW